MFVPLHRNMSIIVSYPYKPEIDNILDKYLPGTHPIDRMKISYVRPLMNEAGYKKYVSIRNWLNVLIQLKCNAVKVKVNETEYKDIEDRNMFVNVVVAKIRTLLENRNYKYIEKYVQEHLEKNDTMTESIVLFNVISRLKDKYETDNIEDISPYDIMDELPTIFKSEIESPTPLIDNNDEPTNDYWAWAMMPTLLNGSAIDKAIIDFTDEVLGIERISFKDVIHGRYILSLNKSIKEAMGSDGLSNMLWEYDCFISDKDIPLNSPEYKHYQSILEYVNNRDFPDNILATPRMAAHYIYFILTGNIIAPNGTVPIKTASAIYDLLLLFGYGKYEKELNELYEDKAKYDRIKYYFKVDKSTGNYSKDF